MAFDLYDDDWLCSAPIRPSPVKREREQRVGWSDKKQADAPVLMGSAQEGSARRALGSATKDPFVHETHPPMRASAHACAHVAGSGSTEGGAASGSAHVACRSRGEAPGPGQGLVAVRVSPHGGGGSSSSSHGMHSSATGAACASAHGPGVSAGKEGEGRAGVQAQPAFGEASTATAPPKEDVVTRFRGSIAELLGDEQMPYPVLLRCRLNGKLQPSEQQVVVTRREDGSGKLALTATDRGTGKMMSLFKRHKLRTSTLDRSTNAALPVLTVKLVTQVSSTAAASPLQSSVPMPAAATKQAPASALAPPSACAPTREVVGLLEELDGHGPPPASQSQPSKCATRVTGCSGAPGPSVGCGSGDGPCDGGGTGCGTGDSPSDGGGAGCGGAPGPSDGGGAGDVSSEGGGTGCGTGCGTGDSPCDGGGAGCSGAPSPSHGCGTGDGPSDGDGAGCGAAPGPSDGAGTGDDPQAQSMRTRKRCAADAADADPPPAKKGRSQVHGQQLPSGAAKWLGSARARKSKYFGASRRPGKSGRWETRIRAGSRKLYLGTYDTGEDGARVFDFAVLSLLGVDTQTPINFDKSTYLGADGTLLPVEAALRGLGHDEHAYVRDKLAAAVAAAEGAAEGRCSDSDSDSDGGEASPALPGAAALVARPATRSREPASGGGAPSRHDKAQGARQAGSPVPRLLPLKLPQAQQQPPAKYRGVDQLKSGRWHACISHSRAVHLGTYDAGEDAARVYDYAALFLRGVNTQTVTNFDKGAYRGADRALLPVKAALPGLGLHERKYVSDKLAAVVVAAEGAGEGSDSDSDSGGGDASPVLPGAAAPVARPPACSREPASGGGAPSRQTGSPAPRLPPLKLQQAQAQPQPQAQQQAQQQAPAKYRGATHANSGRWRACVRTGGRRLHLGTYDADEDAARVYDYAALFLSGVDTQTVTNFGKGAYIGDDGALLPVETALPGLGLHERKYVSDKLAAVVAAAEVTSDGNSSSSDSDSDSDGGDASPASPSTAAPVAKPPACSRGLSSDGGVPGRHGQAPGAQQGSAAPWFPPQQQQAQQQAQQQTQQAQQQQQQAQQQLPPAPRSAPAGGPRRDYGARSAALAYLGELKEAFSKGVLPLHVYQLQHDQAMADLDTL